MNAPADLRKGAGPGVSRLLRFLRPYRLPAAAAVVLVFLQSLAELFLPTLMASIVDEGVVFGDTAHIVRIGAVMLAVAALGSAASVLAAYMASRVSAGFGRDVRDEVFRRATYLSVHDFDHFGTSTLITRTTHDVTQIQHVVYTGLRMMVSAPMMIIGGLIMALSKDVPLTLVLVGAIPVLAAVIAAIARKAMPLFTVLQQHVDALNRVVREGLTGIRVIRAFNRTGYEARRFRQAAVDLAETGIRVHRITAAMMPSMMLILNMTIVAVMWFGGIRIDQGHMPVGDLMAFIQYVMRIMFSLLMVSMIFVMLPRAVASANRIAEVLEAVPESDGALPWAGPPLRQAAVTFENVTFCYPGAEEPALAGVSFQAAPGETVGIIGGTGAGKSTLLHLILRFYDATEGRILVDGVDVRDWPRDALRAHIGWVPQKALLFKGTVGDNIRFGQDDASEDDLRRAAEAAQAMEFIAALDHGFDALVEQGGANFSGGQRQRLTIARALLRRPAIYLFDDSFSALDFKTEARLRQALRRETAGATVFIVAQRISSVMDADRIIVLDQGRMAGMGRHEELLETCSVYREIAASQLAEEVMR